METRNERRAHFGLYRLEMGFCFSEAMRIGKESERIGPLWRHLLVAEDG